jgi:hypothetical protein
MPYYIPQFSETLNLGATIRSYALGVKTANLIGYAVRATGTPTGTLAVQYSNDFIPGWQAGAFPAGDDPTSDAKWDTYTLTTAVPAFAGAGLTFGIILDYYEYAFVRLKYTFTSGSGSLFYAAQMKG